MNDTIALVIFFTVIFVVYLIVRYAGNLIVDKGEEAIMSVIIKHKPGEKREQEKSKTENLSDYYFHENSKRGV